MSFLGRGRAKRRATSEKPLETSPASAPQTDAGTFPTTPRDASHPMVEVLPILREWMAQPTWAASRAWLAVHLADLPAEGVAVLKAAALAEADPRERDRLDLHAYLLMAARREGVNRAYDRVLLPSELLPPPAPEMPPEAAPPSAPTDVLPAPAPPPPTPSAPSADLTAIAPVENTTSDAAAETAERALESPTSAEALAEPPAETPAEGGLDADDSLDAALLLMALALGNPPEMQALLRQHATELVTPHALERARVLLADARAANDPRVEALETVVRLVERLQEVSPEELVTAEVTSGRDRGASAPLVIAWLQTPDWASSRAFLSAHPELLDEATDAVLARLAEQYTDERVRRTLAEHGRLLMLCREHGIAEGYRRFLAERRAARHAEGVPTTREPGVEVPPEARLAAQNALSNPPLRQTLPAEVVEALQRLLEPAPSREELAAGLNALTSVAIALERAYVQGVLTRLAPPLWAWWSTSSWPASRAWLDAHLGELPPTAPALLRQAAEEARARGMEGSAVSCERHADLVEHAWRDGVDAAYRAVIGEDAFAQARDEDLSQLMSQLTAWINTPDWGASHDYLEAHDSLLSTRAEGALALLGETQSGNTRDIVEDHQRLLALCRGFGIEEGYQRFLAALRAERLQQREQAATESAPSGGEGPVALPAGVRELVERILLRPEGIAEEVLAALRPLLSEKPTQEQVSRGLAALAALGAMASRRHARALLVKRSAILATWYEMPTWPASRVWLHAHLEELPADAPEVLRAAAAEARADGDDISAEGIERHIDLIERARREGIDAAYRAVVGEDAFAEDASAAEPEVTRAGRQVEEWIRQRDWESSREYLRAHPDILGDAGTRALDMLQRAQRSDENRQIVADHQRLQRDARERGIDAAYRDFLGEVARAHRPRGRPLNREIERRLIEWLQTPTWDASRAYLTGHPELLSDAGEAGLASLLDIQSNANRRRTVAAHQRLLSLCRRLGIMDGYFAFFDASPESVGPTSAGDEKGEDTVALTPEARELAHQLLDQPESLPPDVVDALRGLLAPEPSQDQIERGLAALAAVVAAASANHAQGLLARRSPLLAEWFATESWPESRAWLQAHLGDLPADAPAVLRAVADEVRAEGDEVGAESLERHASLVEQSRQEGVDSAYRAIVGGDAFGEGASVPIDLARLVAVGQQVQEWIRTPNWGASREYLSAHPDILTETGATALGMLHGAQETDASRQIIADHQRLWADARARSVDAAYESFLRDLEERERRETGNERVRLGRLFIDWMRTPNWETSHAYLGEHPELVSAEGERVLDQLHDIQEDEGARQEIRRHQRLLRYCRELGLDAGYLRFLEEEKGEQTV